MANLMAVGVEAKPMTLNDRVASASADVANICNTVQGMLARAYGPEPASDAGGVSASREPSMAQNVEFLEGNVKRLYGLIERLHGIV